MIHDSGFLVQHVLFTSKHSVVSTPVFSNWRRVALVCSKNLCLSAENLHFMAQSISLTSMCRHILTKKAWSTNYIFAIGVYVSLQWMCILSKSGIIITLKVSTKTTLILVQVLYTDNFTTRPCNVKIIHNNIKYWSTLRQEMTQYKWDACGKIYSVNKRSYHFNMST